jgi:cation:H+ antiporter
MINLLLLLAGFIILIKGADFLVAGASSVAKKYGISNLAIGLTVVAFGTSMPELIVSLLAALNGQNDASFGNVIGSNNFNLLFILGLAGTIYPLVVQKSTVKYEIPISLLAVGVLFFLVNDQLIMDETSNSLGRIDSVVLLLFFAAFMGYIYKTMKNTSGEDTGTSTKVYGMLVATGMVVLGLVMLIGGGKLVVDSAISIARSYGLSEKLVGLTILAAGTSLPELATSAVAAFKRNTDIAIGNVIGSNIFNVFFILGTTGLITPIPYNTALNVDLYVLLSSTIVLMVFMFTLNRAKLDRWEAIILLGAYIAYTAFLISEG